MDAWNPVPTTHSPTVTITRSSKSNIVWYSFAATAMPKPGDVVGLEDTGGPWGVIEITLQEGQTVVPDSN